MKTKKTLTIAFILCFVLKISAQEKLLKKIESIDSYFHQLESYGLSGSLLIGNKENILLNKSYGMNNINNANKAYSIASIDKNYTAAVILMLEQKGLLKTEDGLKKFLTFIPNNKENITLHHLLTHTSGLDDAYWDSEENRNLSENEFINKILKNDLISVPGTEFRYSNFGYQLLDKIIEKITNKTRNQYLIDNVFKKNGIKNTGLHEIKWEDHQIALYDDWAVKEGSSLNLSSNPLDWFFYNGILSTTEDMFKWYQIIFNSENILNNHSKQKMFTPDKNNYGYGWNIQPTQRGTTLIQHGGYDSWLGMVTAFYNYVDEDIVVIYLGNTNMSQNLTDDDLMQNVESLLFGGLVNIPPFTNYSLNDNELKKFYGVYSNSTGSIEIKPGKVKNQLNLRTTAPDFGKYLVFNELSNTEEISDTQLNYFFDKINNNDYDPLKDKYFRSETFEYWKNFYTKTWGNLESSMGEFEGVRLLHQKPYYFEGNFELQMFVEIKFKNESLFARIIRNNVGKLILTHTATPSRIDIYLNPKSKNEFTAWNIKLGTISTIKIENGKLILNNNPTFEYSKQ